MTVQFADFSRQAAMDAIVSEAEIMELREAGWADGLITRAEAEAIFALQHAITNPTHAWSDFFVEAIRQYVLNGTEPRGYASEAEADWLIAEIERDGRVCSMTELELLVEITETARNLPQTLQDFVLHEIEKAVQTGTGPTRDGGELSDTHVTSSECAIIRRTIFGQASERPAAVSRREAEMLFRLKDATLGDANAPEFERLFVQGVGNYLLGFASANAQLGRDRMLELESFVADNKASVGGFMTQMARSAPNAFGIIFGHKQDRPNRSAQVQEATRVTIYEQEWLDLHIGANGEVDAYDRVLIAFIAEETGEA